MQWLFVMLAWCDSFSCIPERLWNQYCTSCSLLKSMVKFCSLKLSSCIMRASKSFHYEIVFCLLTLIRKKTKQTTFHNVDLLTCLYKTFSVRICDGFWGSSFTSVSNNHTSAVQEIVFWLWSVLCVQTVCEQTAAVGECCSKVTLF